MNVAKRRRLATRSAATIFFGTTVLAAGCSVSPQPGDAQRRPSAGVVSGTQGPTASSQYLVIARAGNDRLEIDIDRLSGRDRTRLTASLGDLRDASLTERLFDRRLSEIPFRPSIKMIAESLYVANESRADLTAEAATSRTLRKLDEYEARISVANSNVEDQVRRLRSALRLPPPDTS
jgi:hypothetical protein